MQNSIKTKYCSAGEMSNLQIPRWKKIRLFGSNVTLRENENCDAKIPCQINSIKFCTTSRSPFSFAILIPHHFTKYILKAKWKTWSPQEQAQVLGIHLSNSVSAEGQI